MASDGVGKECDPVFPSNPDFRRKAVPLCKTQIERDEHRNQREEYIECQCWRCPEYCQPIGLLRSFHCLYRCAHSDLLSGVNPGTGEFRRLRCNRAYREQILSDSPSSCVLKQFLHSPVAQLPPRQANTRQERGVELSG